MSGETFASLRPWMFSIAYRMLGSASEAEDVVQEAWLRHHAANDAAIRSPKAFATTVVTRLCLDRLKSARATREEYIGPWLPEPVLTSQIDGPEALVQREESITLAFLVLLERLSPEQRAVFLLKEIFDYRHGDIARVLGMSPEYSRQLLRRAKAKIADAQPRLAGTADARRQIAERFARAFADGDEVSLAGLLADEVTAWSDGGGKAVAARRPMAGRDEVLKFVIGLRRTADAAGMMGAVTWRLEDINAEPALIVQLNGRLEAVFVFSVDRERLSAIRIVRNPDKLASLDRQLTTLH
jgi:RNA polymerase sigma-70 factor (ECF subfamily)